MNSQVGPGPEGAKPAGCARGCCEQPDRKVATESGLNLSSNTSHPRPPANIGRGGSIEYIYAHGHAAAGKKSRAPFGGFRPAKFDNFTPKKHGNGGQRARNRSYACSRVLGMHLSMPKMPGRTGFSLMESVFYIRDAKTCFAST